MDFLGIHLQWFILANTDKFKERQDYFWGDIPCSGVEMFQFNRIKRTLSHLYVQLNGQQNQKRNFIDFITLLTEKKW